MCSVQITSQKQEKGKLKKNKKQIILKEEPLHIFIDDYYLPMLENMLIAFLMLFYCEKMKHLLIQSKNLRSGDIETSRDYTERLVFEKDKIITSEHFGYHISLSIEGVELRYFAKEEVEKYYNNKEISTSVDQKLSKQHFHSHFANISLQNTASTNHNMDILLDG